ncbi:hypothetical protein IQ07DRAFT_142304 [Pyrenochaeta sp. DS3sAY3a]|nr:hypothetical protein IQ07DRAFT_142304 [Pyrenochaeta sp. DS3sAY3a]
MLGKTNCYHFNGVSDEARCSARAEMNSSPVILASRGQRQKVRREVAGSGTSVCFSVTRNDCAGQRILILPDSGQTRLQKSHKQPQQANETAGSCRDPMSRASLPCGWGSSVGCLELDRGSMRCPSRASEASLPPPAANLNLPFPFTPNLALCPAGKTLPRPQTSGSQPPGTLHPLRQQSLFSSRIAR